MQIGLARENGNDVRRKGTHLKIGRAFAKFERANDTVGNDAESDAGDLRRVTKISGFARRPPLRLATAARSERGRIRWGGGKKRRQRSAGTMPMALGMRFT